MSDNTEKEMAMMEAKADAVSAPEQEEDKKFNFLSVPLSKEYDFEGKKIKNVDLHGLLKMTTLDMQATDLMMQEAGRTPANKLKDTFYLKHMAVRASGMPVEFFNQLNIKDINAVTSSVMLYFFV